MNKLEKFGALLGALVIVGGLAWGYVRSQTAGTAAFSPVFPAAAVFVSDDANANDWNDGLSPETPVRTIKRGLEIAGSAGVKILFLVGPEYEVADSDSSEILLVPEPLKQLTITTLPGSGYQGGEGPRDGKTRIWTSRSEYRMLQVRRRSCTLNVYGLWFDGVSLVAQDSRGALATITNNVFDNVGKPIRGVSPGREALVMLSVSGSARVVSNDVNLSRYYDGPIYTAITVGAGSIKVQENDIKFPAPYDAIPPTKYVGIIVTSGNLGEPIGIFQNNFQTVGESAAKTVLEANPHNIGVLTIDESPAGVEIFQNTFDGFDGLEVVCAALRSGSSGIQDIKILNNYARP